MKHQLLGAPEVAISLDRVPHTISMPRKLSACVALTLAGVSLLAADVHAAPAKKAKKVAKTESSESVKALEDENRALREALAAAKKREQELLAKGSAVAPAAVGAEPAASAEAVAQAEEIDDPKDEVKNKNLGEIVVKAKPKLAKLHDVAQAVSVVSGQELSRELSRDLGDITRRAANVQFNQNNTRGASLSIRGLGKRSFTETQDPSVGVTVDGVPYGLSQLANFSFYDVESVEVTRGPRGTEGGLAASSGKVNVSSKAPTFTKTAELSATYGQREALILQGALGGAVIDDLLAWRGSFIVDKARGFYGQEFDDNYTLYNRDRLSGRAQLLFTPTSNLTARLTADFEPRQPQVQNGLTFFHDQPFKFADGSLTDRNGTTPISKLKGYFSHSNQFALTDTTSSGAITAVGSRAAEGQYFAGRGFTYSDFVGGAERGSVWFDENKGQTVHNQGASAQIDWDVADHILSSKTGVREYGFDAHNDEGTPFQISVDGGGGVDYNQWTQEFKIANKPGGFIDYKAGVIGMWTKDNIVGKTGWGADAGAWFATNGQYNSLYRNAGVNRGIGTAILKDLLQDARVSEVTAVRTQSGALFGESDFHFTDDFTLTAGLRTTHEDRKTRNSRVIARDGAGGGFNPNQVRDVNTGGFNSDTASTLNRTDSAGNILKNPDGSNRTITNSFFGRTDFKGQYDVNTDTVVQGDALTNSAQQNALADAVANKYFGVGYGALSNTQRTMIANAKVLRASQLGRLNNVIEDSYKDVLYTAQLTPSYKINDDLTTYFAWQYGEKSGSVAPANGVSRTVKPEETQSFELGLKSFWLDKSVVVNVDAFFMDIKNYQQATQVVDTFQTEVNLAPGGSGLTAYVAAQDNVKKVQVHGIELDSVINTIPNLSIRFNGAYNVAEYVDYKNAPKPNELGYLTGDFVDMSGQLVPGVSKWNFNVGAEYTRPVFDGQFIAHTSFNTNYQTEFNNSDTLSVYGWTPDRARTDAAIGIGSRDKVWDLSLIGKNIFNDTAHEEGWNSYAPDPYPAWFGIQLSGKI